MAAKKKKRKNQYHSNDSYKKTKATNTDANRDFGEKNTFGSEYISMPAEFARALMRQDTYDPRNSSSKRSRNYSLYSRDDILSWLQSPTNASNEQSLRNASIYMYMTDMHYRRLIKYYSELYTGAYILSPLNFDEATTKKDSFVKQFKKVSKAIKLMNLPSVIGDIVTIAMREGVFYGVRISDNNSAFIFKIDPDYCRITAICDGSFLYQVDMTKIADKLAFYPAEFTKMYNDYLATGNQWQEVPIDISVCVKGDPTNVDYCIPVFAAVMPSIYTIANTEALQEVAQELKNYKALAGKIPTDSKGNPTMNDLQVREYFQHVSNALGEAVGLFMTPLEFESFTFENKTGLSDVDDLSNAVSNFWSTAGTSGLLHGKDNSTSGSLKLAIKNDETFVKPIVQQIERVINRYLKTAFSGTTKFQISILPVTVFNREEYLKSYKEAATLGLGKSYYAAALGIAQDDIAGLNYIEREIVPFDELKPLQSTYTQSSSDAGRPASSDEDLDDAGEITREADSNANR